ncbi:hypothetical protein B0H14DRAFT_2591347 [Mycena olivaceomarginata]|nr:hypothetical protein B0H14DRAFT_2591347 [Mycena olivaceomarginata]
MEKPAEHLLVVSTWLMCSSRLLTSLSDRSENAWEEVHFCWVDIPANNLVHLGASNLVQKAAVMDDPFVYTLPDTGSVTLATLSPPSWCTAAKVVTSLPTEDAPKPKPIFEITAEQLATGDNPDSHRSRLKIDTRMVADCSWVH